jgi:hypothetical protein
MIPIYNEPYMYIDMTVNKRKKILNLLNKSSKKLIEATKHRIATDLGWFKWVVWRKMNSD